MNELLATSLPPAAARKYTFPKAEHLCSKKRIEQLFNRRNPSVGVYPLRLTWVVAPARTAAPPEVLITVPKRAFKRAVDRNRLKRLVREAYRLNKHLLTEAENGHPVAQLGILYTGKEKSELPLVEKKLISGLNRLLAEPAVQPAP
ncbi:ribonuclease P protein component [Hymenobacter sp. H14-R3]|uniref:ribonuclease P protein component n=1 Tax=Hymenobacter sp. H14-R3 TaxID=3046308 RepID=UPI0024B9EBE5|nr:ribonuclease P protein component [Hymenobacter sp. H14-R3]MDJ0367723.1 ribonuclease P protein component [Hymenobacter sp. H14-R3]